jgi:hypothetical protein
VNATTVSRDTIDSVLIDRLHNRPARITPLTFLTAAFRATKQV